MYNMNKEERKEYELRESNPEEFMKLIETLYKEQEKIKFTIIYGKKGNEYDSKNIMPFNISCHKDYTLGEIVSISPYGCISKECAVNSPKYKEFIEEELDIGLNAHC